MRELFNEKQKTIIINNYENMSYYEIAELLGDQYTERQIRGWINNNGFRKLRKINDHYFDVIDDQIKAYYLGFIYADGWIINNPTRRCYELGMQLQKQDKYILDRLNMELGHKNNVIIVPERKTIINGIETISSESAKIRISSKNLVIGLEKNGIV